MEKKYLHDLDRLFNLPLYSEKEEFLDKTYSFLYTRYKFDHIKLVEELDESVALDLLKKKKMLVRPKKGQACKFSELKLQEIHDCFFIVFLENKEILFQIRLGKKKYMKKKSELKVIVSIIQLYFQSRLQLIDAVKSEVAPVAPKVTPKIDRTSSKKTFLELDPKQMPNVLSLVRTVEGLEKAVIKEMIKRTQGNKSTAAKQLQITERMIGYKMKKYKII
jgi:DNA-binding protein Fis